MKTNNKKSVLIKAVSLVTAVAMSSVMLTGCGSKGSDKNAQGQTVISVGLWPTREGTELDNANARKARFEEANPDVEIKPDTWGFDRNNFYAKAAGGQLPTVYKAGFTEVAEIINSEYAADLTDVLQKYGYLDKMNEQVVDALSKDGRIYALPQVVATLGFACNMDIMKQAGLVNEDETPKQPKDWNEVLDFALQIKEKTGKPGIVLPTADNCGGWIFSVIAWSYGVDFMEKDADGKWKATFDTPQAAEALQFVRDLKWKYGVLPENALMTNEDWNETFASGGAGMSIYPGTFQAQWAKYGMAPEQVGMMAMPEGPAEHVTLISGDIYCVSNTATEEQIDAAIRWLKDEISPDVTEDFEKVKRGKLEVMVEEKQHVGIKGISMWNTNADALVYEHQLIDEYANANPNHVKLFNDFSANCLAEIRAEEPICCQQLYAILDRCLQEVLSNENADCASVMKKANEDFQTDYLDNM